MLTTVQVTFLQFMQMSSLLHTAVPTGLDLASYIDIVTAIAGSMCLHKTKPA